MNLQFKLTLLVFILFLSNAAFASKARMDALGGEERVFYYFNDTRNIFYNPAYINVVKDFIVFEWGQNHDNKEAGPYSPKPEGGVIKMGDAFVYGIYLGNNEGYDNRILAVNGATQYILNQDNSFEFFLGGDAGMSWATSIKYSQSEDGENVFNKKQESLKIKFGVLSGHMESFLHFSLFDKSKGGETNQEEFRNSLAGYGGINYFIDNLVLYFTGKSDGFEYKRASDGQLDRDSEILSFKLGGGQSYQIDESSKLFVDTHYYREFVKSHSNMATVGQKSRTQLWKIPLTLGVESKVFSWLSLRGSISQNIASRQTNIHQRKKSERNTTQVNAGASLDMGKMKLDGLIGMTDGAGNNNKSGILSASNLMARVALSYWF